MATAWDFGRPSKTCEFYGVVLWYEERGQKSRRPVNPSFTLCCMEGKVQLPLLSVPPNFLANLLLDKASRAACKFRKNIRLYNSMFSFTSMGGHIDTKINDGRGPYIFRLNGSNYHRIGSLLPPSGDNPSFAQLYIHDTNNEISNRIGCFRNDVSSIDRAIVDGLRTMLDSCNVLVKSFRFVRDYLRESPYSDLNLRLLGTRQTDGSQYNLPTVPEVAALIVGDLSSGDYARDVVVYHRRQGLQRITELHLSFMSLSYPLLFPYGEDGYRVGILHRPHPKGLATKRPMVTMREYYCFHLQVRRNESKILHLSGRLFQQFLVDVYMAIEEDRFRWIRLNQRKLRSKLYRGLMDAISRGDTNAEDVGKKIILPSSHTGGPRYRVQNYQDAMAIYRWAGYPDLFLTFTCNPKWPEIKYLLEEVGASDNDGRIPAICRVFSIKLHESLYDLKQRRCFGKTIAVLYTIEFQKRDLPHTHVLLFLHPDYKNLTPVIIDQIVSAEIPDKLLDPDVYNCVKEFMIHGPCGATNINSPCMMKNMCTKHFPKKFCDGTTVDQDGFVVYRRRALSSFVEVKGVHLDNRHVVPYNRNLIVKFQAHINIEVCNRSRSIKYLFKYVNKGPDRASVVVEGGCSAIHGHGHKLHAVQVDEIKTYLDCRYVSAVEACWRIFQFDLFYREPAVERLPFHLPNEQTVVFEENCDIENVVGRPDIGRTKFTEWMNTNRLYADARQLTYVDFQSEWVWNHQGKIWSRRKSGRCIGRIYFAHPASSERYYLRMLLNIVKGSTSFECLRTINGIIYPSYKSACYALGLLTDDKEWIDCLREASSWATGEQLRYLFATILEFCKVLELAAVWRACYEILVEDILPKQRKRFNFPSLQLSVDQITNYTLFYIGDALKPYGKSLHEIEGMPLPVADLSANFDNSLLSEEMNYDIHELSVLHESQLTSLNSDQKKPSIP